MADIFVVTFPFFALVLAGYAATVCRVLPVEAIPGLNVFVLMFALPCMLYRFASNTPIVRLLDPSIVCTYLAGAGQHGARRAALSGLKGMVKNPLPWAIVLGCVSTALRFRLPEPALRGVEMLAEAASPAALFTIGGVLARSRLDPRARTPRAMQPWLGGEVARLVAFKVAVHPLIVLGIGLGLKQVVLVTTVVAFVTFPLAVAWLR